MRTLTIFLSSFLFFFSSCEKKEFSPEIHRDGQSIKIYSSLTGEMNPENQLKNEILDGASFNVYGEEAGKTIMFWTEPLTEINWHITGPDLDTVIYAREAITLKLSSFGEYTVRAFNDPPYSFEFVATINMVEAGRKIFTDGRPVGSTWDETSEEFLYTFRIKKPDIISDSDLLFRITEVSGDETLPFEPIFDGVSITPGGDSIDIVFPYESTGVNFKGIKVTAGYMVDGEDIWFVPDSTSVYKCQDEALNDIFELLLYNGEVGSLEDTSYLSPPADAISGMGDWDQEVPILLMGIDHLADQINLYITSESATTFRYKDLMEGEWIYESIQSLSSNVRDLATLPKGPDSGEWIFQFGTGSDDASFVLDPNVEKSSLFYGPYNGLQIAIGE